MFFFFSSRRRHTRSDRDWSSDVCSSDLRRRHRSGSPRGGPGGQDRPLPGRDARGAREDRPRRRAPLPAQGRLGRSLRRRDQDLHHLEPSGDDPPADAGAVRSRHPGGGGGRQEPERRPGLVRPAGRDAPIGLAGGTAGGPGQGRRGAQQGPPELGGQVIRSQFPNRTGVGTIDTVRDLGAKNGHQHVVIIGAGPAGLTASYELMKHDIATTVLEKDPTYVGGLARTVEHNGYRFDIGGHRFFSKNQEVEDLWTEILGPEMLTRGRLSRIYYRGRYFAYPIKAANALWNLGPIEAVRCMASYAKARLQPIKTPKTLEEWVRNQFGWRLYSIFFKTYTEKVWGISTKELSADWAAQRIKSLDLWVVLKSALLPGRKSGKRGEIVTTLIDRFRYPRLGPGQMWERVAEISAAKGHPVLLGRSVEQIAHDRGPVTSVTTRTDDGATETHRGTHFISSMPMRELVARLDPPAPEGVRGAAEALGYRDFISIALMIDRANVFPDNWIYIHDPGVRVGRIQNFKNWSPDMVPDQSKTCL